MICTNTMHKIANPVAEIAGIPLLHITDPTIAALQQAQITQVGLLGTRFTMEESFYKDCLSAAGFQVYLPNQTERTEVHRVIYDELCQGKVIESSQQTYLKIIENLKNQGAEAIILGCTEIVILLTGLEQQAALPLFDTTELHATAAAEWLIRNP